MHMDVGLNPTWAVTNEQQMLFEPNSASSLVVEYAVPNGVARVRFLASAVNVFFVVVLVSKVKK